MSSQFPSNKQLNFINRNIALFGPSFQAVRKAYKWNISASIPSDIPVYLCPICLNQFIYIKDNILHLTEEFTGDHYPPESVGGKKKALVCKPCNNNFGKDLDFAPAKGLEVVNLLNGTAEGNIKMSINGGKGIYNLQAGWNHSDFMLRDNQKHSNIVNEFNKAIEQWAETGTPIYLSLKITYPLPSVLYKSLLKAAYLSFFSWVGYEFTISPVARNIRAVLKGQMDHPLSNQGVLYDIQPNQIAEGVYAITEPKTFSNFLVSLAMKDPATKRKIQNLIIIPAFLPGSWENQITFAPFENKKEMDADFVRFPNDLLEQGKFFQYSNISNHLFK